MGFVDLLKISGIFLQEKEIKKIFDALDKNGNGKLDFDEITKFIDFMRIKKRNKKRNKKTQEIELTKTSVNIDTRFRSEYYNTSSTNFVYDIPEVQKNVVGMK